MKGLGWTLKLYYQFALAVLISIFAVTFYFFYTSGLSGSSSGLNIYESSIWYDDIQRKDFVEKIKTTARNGDIRNSVKHFEELSKKLDKLRSTGIAQADFSELSKSLEVSREDLNKLVSYPEVQKIFKVFQQRLSKFEKFVVHNRWRTLTRMSARMNSKVSKIGRYSLDEISNLSRVLLQDVTIMKEVTEKSVLSRTDKGIISSRLDTLKTELVMLESYIKDLRKFLRNYTSLESSYSGWISQIGPEVSLAKIKTIKEGKLFTYILATALGLGVLFFCLGFRFNKLNEKRDQRKIEDYMIQFISNRLLVTKEEFSDLEGTFRNEAERLYRYIHKRMSFGSFFQEGVPFSAIMLDSDLKVTWGNEHFCDEWKLNKEKIQDDLVTWDYLHQFTNLDEVDPVVDALQTGNSGIFQIKVKSDKLDNPKPYEMYVSAVNHSDEKRIIVFFYPLSFMEQTINNQALSITQPIKKILTSFIERGDIKSELKAVQDQFFDSGIDDVYDKFYALSDSVALERTGLLSQIEKLDLEKTNLETRNQQALVFLQELISNQIKFKKQFVDLKEAIVSYARAGDESAQGTNRIIQIHQTLINDFNIIADNAVELLNQQLSQNASFEDIHRVKAFLKNTQSDVHNTRAQLQEAVAKAQVQVRKGQPNHMIEGSLDQIKYNAKSFDMAFDHLTKGLRDLDILLTKFEMISEKVKTPKIKAALSTSIQRFKEENKETRQLFSKQTHLNKKTSETEADMIKELKGIFVNYKETLKRKTLTKQVLEARPSINKPRRNAEAQA